MHMYIPKAALANTVEHMCVCKYLYIPIHKYICMCVSVCACVCVCVCKSTIALTFKNQTKKLSLWHAKAALRNVCHQPLRIYAIYAKLTIY